MIWDPSRVLSASQALLPLREGAGPPPGHGHPLALNATLDFVPWLLEEGTEMLGGSHGPSRGAPARLVCVLGEWDVRLLSVSLLQGTSVLSVPPVPAMSGTGGWVRWVPASPAAGPPWVVPGVPVSLQCCPDARPSVCLRDLISLSLSLFSPPSFTVPVPHARCLLPPLFVYSVPCLCLFLSPSH